LIPPSADIVLTTIGVLGVWLTSSGVGAMLGNFAAVLERKPPEVRAHWRDVGAAVGCAFGFLLMLCAIVDLTR
jgi:hypothetical protein